MGSLLRNRLPAVIAMSSGNSPESHDAATGRTRDDEVYLVGLVAVAAGDEIARLKALARDALALLQPAGPCGSAGCESPVCQLAYLVRHEAKEVVGV